MLTLFYLRKGVKCQTILKCSSNDDKKAIKYIKYLYPIADYRFYYHDGKLHDITINGFWSDREYDYKTIEHRCSCGERFITLFKAFFIKLWYNVCILWNKIKERNRNT